MLKPKHLIDLRQKRLDTKKIDPVVFKNNSFTDIVKLINGQLVNRYNEKIERKKYQVLLSRVALLVNEYQLSIPGVQHVRLVEQIVDAITGYDILQPWIAKKSVTNIEIESPDEIFVMDDLKWRKIPVSFGSVKELQEYFYRIFNRLGGRFTQDNPLGKIEDEEWNLRIRAGGFDLRPDSPTLSIRKLRKEILTPQEIRYAMSANIEKFMRFAAAAGYTVGFVGPFGSGKTSILGLFLSWIPNYKHIGLIQSSNEIQKVHPFMRRGLTRELVGELGKVFGEIDLLDFAKQENYQVLALGEFLDEAALTMLHMLQLGMQCAFTFHANSAEGSVHSFTFMVMRAGGKYSVEYVVSQLVSNMDLIVIMDRLRVREIVQFTGEIVDGFPVYETIFQFEVEKEDRHELLGAWKRDINVKLTPKLVKKARWNGIEIPAELDLV